jgi:hypothetical protein
MASPDQIPTELFIIHHTRPVPRRQQEREIEPQTETQRAQRREERIEKRERI